MADSLSAASWLLLFSATTSVIFLALLPYSLRHLYRCSSKVQPSWHEKLKTVVCMLYAAIQLALLMRAARSSSTGASSFDIVEASLGLCASIGLLWLSAWAHKRSIHPSSLITVYLLARLFYCLLAVPASSRFQNALSVFALPCSTLILLIFESQSKRSILFKAYTREPPEATTSFLGNILFLWINPILARGYSRRLSEVDIPVLDQNTSSEVLKQAVLQIWDHRAKPENWATLPRVLLRSLSGPFLGAIIPRIFVIIFRLSQPLIISHAIRFVTSSSVEDDHIDGYWIIIAAATTYIGMALSTSIYKHRLNRLEVMIRGALVGLLYNRALEARGSDEEDGRVVTLMSNDISNVENSGEMFHETWGQASEVVVGTLLLAREVGWLWPVPLVFIFFCSRVSRYVAIHLKPKQGKWNSATQQRISATSSVLGAMKNIKMLGMQQAAADHVKHLRRQEMSAAEGVRWLMVAYNASANALGMFAPVLTIVLYVVFAGMRGDTLDVETAFTTIAILAMITHPANMVMTIVPRAVVSFSSFERIQAYILNKDSATGVTSVTSSELTSAASGRDVAISLNDVNITALGSQKLVLRDINLDVFQGSVTIITGPVGSGKTILASTILGEMRVVSGLVRVYSKHIAYCSQIAWLPNRTIRDIILGPGNSEDRDWAWYHATIRACCLDSDLDILPDGDLTSVGSKGSNLSGGQAQRVALARAVYSRCDIFVLDDSFSALDGKTQYQVIHNLLGPEGLLKKLGSTVLWISTAMQHFHLANDIVFLAEGTIKKRGTYEQLRTADPQLLDLIHEHDGAAQHLDTPQRDEILTNRKPTAKPEQDPFRANGDLSLYSYYFRASKIRNILLLVTANALCAFFITIPPYWLKVWTDSPNPSTSFYTAIYIALLLAAWISTNGIMSSTLLLVAPTSGLTLHSRLLHTIVNAPLSYFSSTDTGSILNRFSSDLQLVDKALAPALANLCTQIFKLLVQTTLLLLSQPLIALTLPPSILVVYIVQRVYLRTSRQLRILELSSRAAVLSSFIETVAGAPTIRAFGWQSATTQQASDVLDGSQRPMYLLLCLQRWLNVVLDLLVAAVAVAFVAVAVRLRTSTTGGEVGVALNVILVVNTTLLKLVANWTDLEISLGAVARLREVEEGTAGEEEEEGLARGAHDLPEDWPARGEIVFSDVTASYKASAVPSLENFALTIEAGRTVVVCGRTGSGKSSMLLSLLRLLDTEAGTITIDGIDITSLSRTMIRERVFITVAQSAFFMPQGSLRFNLDPAGKAETAVLVGALKRTGLWHHFRSAGEIEEDETVLSMPLSSLPVLSTGQTQLLAFARAVVRKYILCNTLPSTYSDMRPIKPIILLDEVTASLDPVTEGKVNDIIQEEFMDSGHTVVMVTHKLAGIKGRLRSAQDIVVWMSEGTIGRIEHVDERI